MNIVIVDILHSIYCTCRRTAVSKLLLIVLQKSVSRATVPTGDRKKITNKVHEKSGKEEEEPEFNKADDCNVLLVVDKGVGKEEIEA